MQELLGLEWAGEFVGLGLDDTIPKFLRTNAKIKNRHMSKVRLLPCFLYSAAVLLLLQFSFKAVAMMKQCTIPRSRTTT